MITEARLEKAMTYLATTDEQAADLKAEVERSEFKAKTVKATMFLHMSGTVAEREAESIKSNEVQDAYRTYFQAVRDYQAVANKRELERVVVELWRSINANRRQGTFT